MQIIKLYPIILGVISTFWVGWLLPKSGKSYDLLKIKIDLFPYWLRYASLLWLIISLIVAATLFDESKVVFSLVNLNFALFLFFFSKRRNEDEFSEQLRLKSFLYSFIPFVVFLILFGAISGSSLELPTLFIDYSVQVFLCIAFITSLVYFYYTLYKSSKENN